MRQQRPQVGLRAAVRRHAASRFVLAPVALCCFAVALVAVEARQADGRDSGCAAADTLVRVGIVVDHGVLASTQGAPAKISSKCVAVPDGANGFQILEAAGHTYTVGVSGLVCSIDGFPNSGECGLRTASGYRYWAYYHGDASGWTHAGIGPGAFRAHGPSVEGWHFVEGKGNPSDPPPGVSPDPSRICTPTPPPTAAPTAPTTVSGPAPPGGATTTPTGAPDAAGRNPPPPSSAAGSTPGPGVAGDASTAGGQPVGDDLDSAGSATSPGTTAAPVADGAGNPAAVVANSPNGVSSEVALDATASSDKSPAGAPVGVIIVIVAIVALGGVAASRFRSGAGDG